MPVRTPRRLPLAYETASNVYARLHLQTQDNNKFNFVARLSQFHEKSPGFVENMLDFLNFCEEPQVDYANLNLSVGQD